MVLRVETTQASKNHSSPIPPTNKPPEMGGFNFKLHGYVHLVPRCQSGSRRCRVPYKTTGSVGQL